MVKILCETFPILNFYMFWGVFDQFQTPFSLDFIEKIKINFYKTQIIYHSVRLDQRINSAFILLLYFLLSGLEIDFFLIGLIFMIGFCIFDFFFIG